MYRTYMYILCYKDTHVYIYISIFHLLTIIHVLYYTLNLIHIIVGISYYKHVYLKSYFKYSSKEV